MVCLGAVSKHLQYHPPNVWYQLYLCEKDPNFCLSANSLNSPAEASLGKAPIIQSQKISLDYATPVYNLGLAA